MKRFILSSLLSALCFGCGTEKQVDITLATSTRDNTVLVDDTSIELTEGEAIGIHVEAFENDEAKPQWSIHATSENRSYAEIVETAAKDDDVFVLIARRPGSTNLRFELRERDFVYVPVTIRPRDEWRPPSAGGADADE